MRSQTDSVRIREGEENGDPVEMDVFVVHGGVLTANSDLYWELLEEFEEACGKLLKSKRQNVVVDLTAVNFISSSFLGCLNNMVMKASRLKKRINLKVTLDVSWLFDIMGGRRNMVIEVV